MIKAPLEEALEEELVSVGSNLSERRYQQKIIEEAIDMDWVSLGFAIGSPDLYPAILDRELYRREVEFNEFDLKYCLKGQPQQIARAEIDVEDILKNKRYRFEELEITCLRKEGKDPQLPPPHSCVFIFSIMEL